MWLSDCPPVWSVQHVVVLLARSLPSLWTQPFEAWSQLITCMHQGSLSCTAACSVDMRPKLTGFSASMHG